MDRMAEEDFHLERIKNGSQAKRADIYFNLTQNGGQPRATDRTRQIILPNDEKLIAQLTSRQKLYEGAKDVNELESKADPKSRGGESPDRADASDRGRS